MGCSNCFNGCGEPTSDKCIKYTGVSIPSLEISNGDTLLSVQNKIINYLLTTLDGTGIIPYISPEMVSNYLPQSEDINLVQIIEGLFNIISDLELQLTETVNELFLINDNYDLGCLLDIDASSGIREITQSIILKLCDINTLLLDLSLNVSTNYVSVSNIDTYIESYLSSTTSGVLASTKMIPYVAYEYYGPLTNFDVTGAGTGDWVDVYLCNGNNGTPDKRGRTTVGAIVAVGGGTLDSAVDPSTSTNPNYALGDKTGANAVTLTSAQIPSHTHTGTTSSDGEHNHLISEVYNENSSGTKVGSGGGVLEAVGTQQTNNAGLHSHSLNINPIGGGESHSNIQPTIAAYYIIYLP